MAGSRGLGAGGLLVALWVAGCQALPSQPHVAASQIISSGPGGTTLYQGSDAGADRAFDDLDAMLGPAPDGGQTAQGNDQAGTQQVIQASPNPATNLGGFLNDVFQRVGVGGHGQPGSPSGPGTQQSIAQGSVIGSGSQQSISQSSSIGSGSQQSLSMGSGDGMQQQIITNSDGTVSVQRSGPGGNGVWRSETQTYRRGDDQRPLRSVDTRVSREGDCLEVSRTRTVVHRPDGSVHERLRVNRDNVCTGESLGEVRAHVETVDGVPSLVGRIIRPDGSVQDFTRPLRQD